MENQSYFSNALADIDLLAQASVPVEDENGSRVLPREDQTMGCNSKIDNALKNPADCQLTAPREEESIIANKSKDPPSEEVLLPDHLRTRISKAKSDAQIKEFVKLTCDLCASNHSHRSFKDLLDHFHTKHGQRGYAVCCEKKFYRKDRLMNHITNHINPDAFK